jgi:hypothetical protein
MKFLNYLIRAFFSLVAILSSVSIAALVAYFFIKRFSLLLFIIGLLFLSASFILSFSIALNKINIVTIKNKEKFTARVFFLCGLLFSLIGFYLAFSEGENSQTKTFNIAVAILVLIGSLGFLVLRSTKNRN